jgi:hypothetical protein
MPEFEFVVSDGTRNKRPSAAVRSHAVKSGLQRKNQAESAGGDKDSRVTIRQKDSLKGRFRLSDGNGENKKATKADNKHLKKPKSSTRGPRPPDDTTQLQSDQPTGTAPFDASTLETQFELVRSPSQGQDDPFSTFPVPLTGDIHNLVRFCKS